MSLQIVSVLDKNVCTAEEYSRSLRDGTITCLTKGDTMGLFVIVEAGLVSLGAILCLFAIITRNTIWRRRHIREARLRLFHKPMDLLMFCVLLADVIQAIGMILNLRWILLGKVELGTFCTTQGFIKLIGSTAVALFTLAIAIYTFLGVWMAKDITSLGLTFGVVMAIWVLNASLAVVGPLVNRGEGNPSFMSVAPYWSSTSKHYLLWKTMSDYIFRWITLFASILIYISLYLWLRLGSGPGQVRAYFADPEPEPRGPVH